MDTKKPRGIESRQPKGIETKTIERRKPDDERKDTSVRIRLTDAQKQTIEKAAAKSGLDVSGWLRYVGLREAGKLGEG